MSIHPTYYFYSNPLLAVHGNGFTCLPNEKVIPSQNVTAGSISALVAMMDAYEARARETGRPYVIGVNRHPHCKARGLPGFEKATHTRGHALHYRFGNVEAISSDESVAA